MGLLAVVVSFSPLLLTSQWPHHEKHMNKELEEFYEIYNNVKQLDVGFIKVQRPQSEFSDGPPY